MSLEPNDQGKRFTNGPFLKRISFKFWRKAQQSIGASRIVLPSLYRNTLLARYTPHYKIRRTWLTDLSRTIGSYPAAACLVWGLHLTGCAQEESTLPKTSATMACFPPAAEREVVVGVTISGGGSRAALFGAAGLEALGKLRNPQGGSVLEQVTYLSSVSGGSLAAAYYALHKPPSDEPVLVDMDRKKEPEMSKAYNDFFYTFKVKLATDFENAVSWRQLVSFRSIFSSALAARSLQEILAEDLLGPDTFNDLSVRQKQGDSPQVIFNTTIYNDGRRFLFTNIYPEDVQYDLISDLEISRTRKGIDSDMYKEIIKSHFEHLLPVTPLDLQINPCPVQVAEAVATSASAPPLLGPITFHVGEEHKYWHIGDGALYENLGLESLMFVLLKQLQEKKLHRTLIISFNSGFPFSVGIRSLGRRSEPWSWFSYDYSRIVSIMEERATNYWSLFYRSLKVEGVLPDDLTLDIVFLNHEDANWAEDLRDLPVDCRNEKPPLNSLEDVQERIAEIPTRFVVESKCDRELLFTAAAKVVEQNRDKIEGFLASHQTPNKSLRRRIGKKPRKI